MLAREKIQSVWGEKGEKTLLQALPQTCVVREDSKTRSCLKYDLTYRDSAGNLQAGSQKNWPGPDKTTGIAKMKGGDR